MDKHLGVRFFCLFLFSLDSRWQDCDLTTGHCCTQILADKHRHTLFLRANAEDAPFLTMRLGVKVLPCVVCFVDGNAVDR